MSAPTTVEMLKFANVQMAAEAFEDSDAPLGLSLTSGKPFIGIVAPKVQTNC